jgi:hypothetical protein
MSRQEWERTYWRAWETYYTPEHMATLMRRAAATGISLGKMVNMLVSFWSLSLVERVHPLEGGYGRRKIRRDRRPGLPVVPAWLFWPVHAVTTFVRISRIALMTARLVHLRHQLKRDSQAVFYRDLALTPVSDDAPLELFTATPAAVAAAAKRKWSVAATA